MWGHGEPDSSNPDDSTDPRATTLVRDARGELLPESEARLVLIVLLHGGMREVELPPDSALTVGRAPESDIQVEHRSVSRIHARLTTSRGRRVLVEDLGSSNGTFVNNEPVTGARSASFRDVIRVGDVTAHIAKAHSGLDRTATLLEPGELDRRVVFEAERALRFDRRSSVLCLRFEAGEAQLRRARGVVQRSLRELDLMTARDSGDLDVVLTECDREDARLLAERLREVLAVRAIPVRIGCATFPGDAPSPGLLLEAAHLAAASRQAPGVTAAGEAARILRVGTWDVVIADLQMQRVFARIERAALTGLSVLIGGETGSGKEIAAEAIHELSSRAGKPLVKINIAAIPDNLLESELFGHERGAFSGALAAKPGLFELADGGTVFLDEIGEIKLDLQAKLLRVLEDNRVRRVGGVKDTIIDVRVVSASHRDLRQEAEAGRFREDLFYRLNGVAIRMPPLRERRSEILLLAKQFAARACRAAGLRPVPIGRAAAEMLQRYDWPGNIRELKQAVEQAALMCHGDELEPDDLPFEVRSETAAGDADSSASIRLSLDAELRALERRRIGEALAETGGNQTQAAKLLGIPRRTLVSKMASLGLTRPRRDDA